MMVTSFNIPLVPEIPLVVEPLSVSLVSPTVEQSQQSLTPTLTLPVSAVQRPAQFYIPSYWEISPEPDGTITAYNSAAAYTFRGTREEFKRLLRGAYDGCH